MSDVGDIYNTYDIIPNRDVCQSHTQAKTKKHNKNENYNTKRSEVAQSCLKVSVNVVARGYESTCIYWMVLV